MKITSVRTDNGRQTFKSDMLAATECYASPGSKEVIRAAELWHIDYDRGKDLITKEPLGYLQSRSRQKA
jgi:hypothetical protein